MKRSQFFSVLPFCALLLLLSTTSADMSVELIRDTCIPEYAYHGRETKESSMLAAAITHGFESFDDGARNKRLRLLADNELYLSDAAIPACSVPLAGQDTQRPANHGEENLTPLIRVVCIPALRYLEIELIQEETLLKAISEKMRLGNTPGRDRI